MQPPTALAAHTIEGDELRYMALAMEREQAACRSLLMVAGAVLSNVKPVLPTQARGCIALAFTACVLAVACSHLRPCLLIPSRAASSGAALHWRWYASEPRADCYADGGGGGPSGRVGMGPESARTTQRTTFSKVLVWLSFHCQFHVAVMLAVVDSISKAASCILQGREQ